MYAIYYASMLRCWHPCLMMGCHSDYVVSMLISVFMQMTR
jgi:hypothetical protein